MLLAVSTIDTSSSQSMKRREESVLPLPFRDTSEASWDAVDFSSCSMRDMKR